MRRTWMIVVLLPLVLAACGGGDDASRETGPVDVGAAFEEPSTTSTVPSSTSSTPPAVAAETATTLHVPNGLVTDVEGWRLIVAVRDGTTHSAAGPITFELAFTNTSGEVRYTDAAQGLHFGLVNEAGEFVWTDQSCGGAVEDAAGETHAATAHGPGEGGQFVERYPYSAATEAGGADGCSVPPGRYGVVGQLDWCPPESLEDVTYREKQGYVCRPEAVRPLLSQPVAIELTA